MSTDHDLAVLLRAWGAGDDRALDQLMPILYDDLRRVARAHLRREQAWHSLQATALVHEVYLRLVKADALTLDSRPQFLAVAARLMRQILVDHARRKRSAKRGGGLTIVGLDDAEGTAPAAARASAGIDLFALDRALEELAQVDPRLCDLVELRYFAGLTIAEAAAALNVSAATVEREWTIAKAWLYDRLS